MVMCDLFFSQFIILSNYHRHPKCSTSQTKFFRRLSTVFIRVGKGRGGNGLAERTGKRASASRVTFFSDRGGVKKRENGDNGEKSYFFTIPFSFHLFSATPNLTNATRIILLEIVPNNWCAPNYANTRRYGWPYLNTEIEKNWRFVFPK